MTPDGYVDPIGEVPPLQPAGAGGQRESRDTSHEGRIAGEVIAVHRRTTGHHEGGHLLDTTVGAVDHSEVVIQVDHCDLEGLVGKRVVIHFLT
jgi:hypothetical protein